ncbi:MAG: NAD-dependent succinate-semialdehyde dehydrogenase [Burkholderiaceae bacterium]
MSSPALPDSLHHPALLQSGLLIDNSFGPSSDDSAFLVHNPANGAALAQVANTAPVDVERALASAAAALPAWRALPARDRSAVLRRWFELITTHQDDLALLMTLEQGKPLGEAKAEVAYGASFIEWFAEQGKRVEGRILASPRADRQLWVTHEPVGVCVAITPWNFPIAMLTRKLGPALAAGCTVIVKPAEQTPLSALALAYLARLAGLPAGVLAVLPADAERSVEVGGLLCASPVVRKLSFTGSTAVGRLLMAQCAPTVKRLSLELGGNAPFIVFPDADLDAAVEGAITSKYRNNGQTCVCSNRLYVHHSVVDTFSRKLTDRVRGLTVGPGWEDGMQLGPLIDEPGLAKVQEHVADALAHGARLLTGGKPHALGGLFYEPTVLTGATAAMQIAREETFGPVAPIFGFSDETQVVQLANATEAGLAAYFYSRDVERIMRVAAALEYGMIGVNTGTISHEMAPFGGVKQSGIGREGSQTGIDEYLETKYVCLGLAGT